jgi:hypothetical protein
MSDKDDIAFTTAVKAGNYTLTNNDYYVSVEAPTANVTLTLPLASSVPAGRPYYFTRDTTATYTVTVTTSGSDKINSTTNGTIAVGAAATAGGLIVLSDGTQWFTAAKF